MSDDSEEKMQQVLRARRQLQDAIKVKLSDDKELNRPVEKDDKDTPSQKDDERQN